MAHTVELPCPSPSVPDLGAPLRTSFNFVAVCRWVSWWVALGMRNYALGVGLQSGYPSDSRGKAQASCAAKLWTSGLHWYQSGL